MLPKTAVHAVRALAALAALPPAAYAGAAEIAEQIGAPRNYLGKLLKTLADAGLVESQKGKGGGFRLARPPRQISILDLVEPIDRVSRWSGCFLGGSRCSDNAPCAVHERWGKVRDLYLRFLRSTTLADLVDQAPAKLELVQGS